MHPNKLNCKVVSNFIKEITIENILKYNLNPELSVLVSTKNGNISFDTESYLKNKLKYLKNCGIKSSITYFESTKPNYYFDVLNKINEDNLKPEINGTILQYPLHEISKQKLSYLNSNISPLKDVDGLRWNYSNWTFGNKNGLTPNTPLGILSLLMYYNISVEGKHVVIVGKGDLVGNPLGDILENYSYYASVTKIDVFTKDKQKVLDKADIIITCYNSPNDLKSYNIPNGCIVIDAGICFNTIEKKMTGNVHPDSYSKCKYYTSVPGGVGLLTCSSLAFSIVKANLMQKNLFEFNLLNLLKSKLNSMKYRQMTEKNEVSVKNLKIMLLSTSYNSLSQNVEKNLLLNNYSVKFVEFSNDEYLRKNIDKFNPDLVICPTLTKAIPKDIYSKIICLIVHPGVKGDRGPSSLDWAILKNESTWGVTLLQADEEMDAGDIWESEEFSVPSNISKSELYNKHVTSTALKLIFNAIKNFKNPDFKSESLDYSNSNIKGRLHETLKQSNNLRTINWEIDSTELIVKKINSADGQPGVKASIEIGMYKENMFLYGVTKESENTYQGNPGSIIKKRNEAIMIKTIDGAIWVSNLRLPKTKENNAYKLPATVLLEGKLDLIKELYLSPLCSKKETFQDMWLEKNSAGTAIFYFDFYNGAMSTSQCLRMNKALEEISLDKEIKVLVLAGSSRNWSNGLHLNVCQNAINPAVESYNNIVAINKISKAIFKMKDKIVISAIRANAGAGGVFFPLASDYVFADKNIVLNPHYIKLGLHGSEFHTLFGKQLLGIDFLNEILNKSQPMIVEEAININLINNIDNLYTSIFKSDDFFNKVKSFANDIANNPIEFKRCIQVKLDYQENILKGKQLEDYEELELNEMKKDIFLNRNMYNEKRNNFVNKIKT